MNFYSGRCQPNCTLWRTLEIEKVGNLYLMSTKSISSDRQSIKTCSVPSRKSRITPHFSTDSCNLESADPDRVHILLAPTVIVQEQLWSDADTEKKKE